MKTPNYISSNPNILGGMPVIKGTRIPISRILYLLSQGYTVSDIKKDYPQLSRQTISRVIATIAQKAEKGEFLTA